MFEDRSVLALSRDGSTRYVPWVIALMVYLAALAVIGGVGLHTAARSWEAGSRAVVVVDASTGGEGAEVVGERIEAALEIVRETAGIESARLLSEDEVGALLEPWLGTGAIARDLPVPVLIDVEPSGAEWVDWEGLRARIQAAVPGAELLTGKMWLGRLADLARTIQVIAAFVVVLVTIATTAMVAIVTRAGLDSHADLVELLHLMGARDRYIAFQFQNHALRLGLRGALIGLIMVGLTAGALAVASGSVDAVLLPSFDIELAGLVAVVALPLATAAIAVVTARQTVIRSLARLP